MKPESEVVRLIESENWRYAGSCDRSALNPEGESLLNVWFLQTEPFLCIAHLQSQAFWIPPRDDIPLACIKALLWRGTKADLEKSLVELEKQ